MTPPDWSVTEWAADQIRHGRWAKPWVLSLEYGGIGPLFEWRSDAAVIAADLPRLYSLAERLR